jgi:hypothetical protein
MKVEAHRFDVSKLVVETERSPGVHFSDLIKPILRKMDPKRFKGTDIDPEFVFAGLLWEEVVSGALARMARAKYRYLKQVEVEFRGVFLTMDTFDIDRSRVHEYKATEMSSARPITDIMFWHYFVQLKAYCLATGTNEAELWVYYMRGDYRKKRRDAVRYECRFSRRELEENWLMLENVRKGLR